MVETILLAFIAAKIKGYKIKPLFKAWAIYLVASFALLYIVLQAMVFYGEYGMLKYAFIFKPLYLIMFIIPMIRYDQYAAGFIGSAFIIARTTLNKIVMSANSGKMPVFATLSKITGYVKPDTPYGSMDGETTFISALLKNILPNHFISQRICGSCHKT